MRAFPGGDRMETQGVPRAGVIALALAAVMACGLVDYWSGEELAPTIAYLLPVAFAAWHGGRGPGLVAAGAACVVWLLADLALRPSYRVPGARYWNLAAEGLVYATVAVLVAELRQRLAREERLARVDSLTGISNRRAFLEVAERELERARRYGHPVTLAYFDIDDFKSVNDRQGHAAGDALLATVATRLQAGCRSTDLVTRLGGDEFAVLLPETTGDTAESLVARLRSQLKEDAEAKGWPVGFSVGIVSYAAAPASIDEMIGRADLLMYEVKATGKDGFRVLSVEA
jgi:diguanylate cyclase (GGDEF)-like protein